MVIWSEEKMKFICQSPERLFNGYLRVSISISMTKMIHIDELCTLFKQNFFSCDHSSECSHQ